MGSGSCSTTFGMATSPHSMGLQPLGPVKVPVSTHWPVKDLFPVLVPSRVWPPMHWYEATPPKTYEEMGVVAPGSTGAAPHATGSGSGEAENEELARPLSVNSVFSRRPRY